MKKIFVVEDEESLRNLIEAYLVKEGFMVVTAQNGLEAIEKWRDSLADIIILDIMMPGLDGYEVLDYIRKDSKVPVVFLTAKRELEDKIKGFETGADDYLVKPFSMKELVMRAKAILKRSGNQEEYLQTYGELTIDLIKMEARVSGELIELSHKEYELLAYMAKNINIPISRGKLLDRL
jgi:DNA-binding response OmpR family regulator